MTAAPGPQQPDEVRPVLVSVPAPACDISDEMLDEADRIDADHGPTELGRWLRAVAAHLMVTHPAAPSAQPNAVGARIHHAIPDDHPVWQQLLDQAAQPVRDTEEGRR